MSYIKGHAREQTTLMPACIADYISEDNPVRIIDAFVDTLDMVKLGFMRAMPAVTGTPGYDPKDMLKLYIYAYLNRVRSSRKIAKEASRNLEVMWLIGGLTPDFRTVSDFRKDNAGVLKGVFKQWNILCRDMELFKGEYVSIDGSKFKANNSKDRNFTLAKLDDRCARIDAHIEEYLAQLDDADTNGTDELTLSKEDIQKKIIDLKERKCRYEGYRTEMERTGRRQISLTDPSSRLMKFKEGFEVGYNVQCAIDSTDQMIADFLVTDHATDHGLLKEVADGVCEQFGIAHIDAVADKGYQCKEDMVACLEAGIAPNVHPERAGGTFELTCDFEPSKPDDILPQSTRPEDIKRCLHAGVIPDIYEDAIESVEVVKEKVASESVHAKDSGATPTAEEMSVRARTGYFVRDIAKDTVWCPEGHILRPKSVKKDGSVRYANRLACKGCKDKCTKARYKEIDFTPGKCEVACRARKGVPDKKSRGGRGRVTYRKVVRFTFRPDQKKLAKRMSLSEHPFGTVKRWDNSSYLLLQGKKKVTAELSLSFLTYNIRRAITLFGGVRQLVDAIKEHAQQAISALCRPFNARPRALRAVVGLF